MLFVDRVLWYVCKSYPYRASDLFCHLMHAGEATVHTALLSFEGNMTAVRQRASTMSPQTDVATEQKLGTRRGNGWSGADIYHEIRIDPELRAKLHGDMLSYNCTLRVLLDCYILACDNPPTQESLCQAPITGIAEITLQHPSLPAFEIMAAVRIAYNVSYGKVLKYYYENADREKVSMWVCATPKERLLSMCQVARHPVYNTAPLNTKNVLWEWV